MKGVLGDFFVPRLLVSVRSAAEAEEALKGGAAIIDVKEPSRGSLGRADNGVLSAIVDRVAGRVPVSAAFGELSEESLPPKALAKKLAFLKWGLAGCAGWEDWRGKLEHLQTTMPATVVVAGYGDWRLAKAPPLEEVVSFACRRPGNVLLLDTFSKTGGQTLLDWLSPRQVSELCGYCRDCDVRIALAGSLGKKEIQELLPARPHWFAVRGAVCAGGDRQATVSYQKVQELVALLASLGGKTATSLHTEAAVGHRETKGRS